MSREKACGRRVAAMCQEPERTEISAGAGVKNGDENGWFSQ